MQVNLRKQHIPWLMAAARAALGPVIIASQLLRTNGIAVAALIIIALLSDIFDGVLARRWHCDTPAVRLFDSMADTVFYLCVAIALWIGHRNLLHANAALLLTLLSLEAARMAFDIGRFGKPTSYHSYLAKAWGLVLASAVVAAFATTHAQIALKAALLLGIACNLEGFAMSLLLRNWHNDVKTLRTAWHIRQTSDSFSGKNPQSSNILRATKLGALALMLCIAAPIFAADITGTTYVNGSASHIAAGEKGRLSLDDPSALTFRSASGANITIPYAAIKTFEYHRTPAHHLGILPALAVVLFKPRWRHHFITIGYEDTTGAKQLAVFEVPKTTPPVLVPLLRLRTTVCNLKDRSCGGSLTEDFFN